MPKLGEFEIIERFFARAVADPAVRVGIGDDAAIVATEGEIAVAVDTLVAGTHFPADLAADAIGHRALAVNLSDLAAVGAKPRFATLALCLKQADPDWLGGFAAGFFRLAERHGVSLIGGDTTKGPLIVTVGVIGDAPRTPLLRSGGRPGDRIFVSGTVGDAAAGLEQLAARTAQAGAAARALIERFRYPEPRVALGRALAGLAHAAIDVSDGLAADLAHLCRLSGCGAVIDLGALPLSEPLRALYAIEDAETLALSGGDDYELCFAVAPADVGRVRDIAARIGTPVSEIGELEPGGAIEGRRDGRPVALAAAGYVHF